jgi:hypothetical protein
MNIYKLYPEIIDIDDEDDDSLFEVLCSIDSFPDFFMQHRINDLNGLLVIAAYCQ